MPREKILSSPAYWFEKTQNELFRQFHYYMEKEKINQTQLGERLGITKGRVSQILQGQSNFTMKTLIELVLSIGIIPKINYTPIEDEVYSDMEFAKVKRENRLDEKKTEIQSSIMHVVHFVPYKIPIGFDKHLNADSSIVEPNTHITLNLSSVANEPNYG
jgi:transcriptional regulator with XRE-family HTH domain